MVQHGYGKFTYGMRPATEANGRTGGANGGLTAASLRAFTTTGSCMGRTADRDFNGTTTVDLSIHGAITPASQSNATGAFVTYPSRPEAREREAKKARRESHASAPVKLATGPAVSFPTSALARPVKRLEGNEDAGILYDACVKQNVAKLATASVALWLGTCDEVLCFV
mgnify:FL=1